MVALNFQARFADDVATWIKRQSIRAPRKDGRDPKPGDHLQLYAGMRTKACRKLITPDPVCASAEPIIIYKDAILVGGANHPDPDTFARADGFADFSALRDWFRKTHGLPFVGRLYKW